MARHNLYQAAPTGQRGTNNASTGFSMYPNVDVSETDNVGPSAAHRGHTTHQVIERCLDFRQSKDCHIGPRDAWTNSDALVKFAKDHPIAVGDTLAAIIVPAGEDWRTLYYTICADAPGLVLGIREEYSGTDYATGIDASVAGVGALFDVVDDLGADRIDWTKNRMLSWVIEALPAPAAAPCRTADGPMDSVCICMQAEVIYIHTGK